MSVDGQCLGTGRCLRTAGRPGGVYFDGNPEGRLGKQLPGMLEKLPGVGVR